MSTASPRTRTLRRMRPLARVCVLAILLTVATTAVAAEPKFDSTAHEFAIRGARIFDGRRVLERGDVWIRDGRIHEVGRRLSLPPGIGLVDGRGRTLLPGLIDTHVHTMGEPDFLRSALALGVTTEVDMGAAPEFATRIKREQAAGGDGDMADLFSTLTQPTAPEGHGTEYGRPIPTVANPDEAQGIVDRLVEDGADFIGEIVYDDGHEFGLRIPTLTQASLRAVIEAAHRRGKLAVVHVLSLSGAKAAIEAGADGLAHLFADAPPDDEFMELAVHHRVFVIATLSLFANLSGQSAGPALARDPAVEPYLGPTAIADLLTRVPKAFGDLQYAEQAVHRLKSRGVAVLAGTDAHNPGTAHGASLLDELRLLVDSGLTPIEALTAATSASADAFRLANRGRIAAGLRADLLLVDGDPTRRISDVKAICAVWKRGVAVDREALRATLTSEKLAETALRRASPPAGAESGLISDFEAGTAMANFGAGWRATTGRLMGGAEPSAEIAVTGGGANGSSKALEITGEISTGVFGWAGATFFAGPTPADAVNLSSKSEISFWTRGDGQTYAVMIKSRSHGVMPLVRPFVAGPEWTRIKLPLAEFGTDGSDLQTVTFGRLASPGSFRFRIDDVRLD